jgi:tetratricopeptide (TPR) repeat protein
MKIIVGDFMRIILCFLFLLVNLSGFAQENDAQLADAYYGRGEYAKAMPYSEKVYERDPSKANFLRLLDCYNQTNQVKDAEKLLKKQVSTMRYDYDYPVMLGQFYEDNGEETKAQKIYEKLIDDLPNDASSIINTYNAFRVKNKNDLALKTLEKGQKLLKTSYPFQIQFADLYGVTGQTQKMIDAYIDLLDNYPSYLSYVQNVLGRKIDFSNDESDEYNFLKTALLEKIQKDPESATYSQMLIWLFIQKRNFSAALIQVQALDRREEGQGARVFELGRMCLENKEYSVARNAFQYVRDLGNDKRFYYPAETALLNTRYIEVTSSRNYTQQDVQEAILEYEKALERLGIKNNTLDLVLELAHIEAFYGGKPISAIDRLSSALQIPGLTDMQRAETKMQLADIEVLNADIWEASIFYMQIDKDFKYEPIGQEAKFKNARIYYYDGEFDFAQSQLDVLKQSTTKLIANDAMQLSLLITENYGLDSNYEAMYWFSRGDLLIEQHKYDEAFVYFDSIQKVYNFHSLGDDILLKKSYAMQRQGKWTDAVDYLTELLKYYPFDILADDAVFQLGDIYQNQLSDNEKASEYYRKILFDYKGSLYTIEARKRFRILRGDKISEDEL